TSVW
ncbi:aldehyde dehydrogenase family protein, partial [Vibrio parahaemolyticus V-223/04]